MGGVKRALAFVCALCLVTAGPIAVENHTGVDDVPSVDDAVGPVDALAATTALAVGVVVGGGVGAGVGAAGYAFLTDDKADTTQYDASQVWADITQSAKAQWDKDQVIQTAYENYLNDTQSIARMEGKNAYVRALENGSSQSVAEQAAREAIGDYYAQKQINLIKSYNASATHLSYLLNTTINEEGITEDEVFSVQSTSGSSPYLHNNTIRPQLDGNSRNVNVTLVNGTVIKSIAMEHRYDPSDTKGAVFVTPAGYSVQKDGLTVDDLGRPTLTVVNAPPSIDYVSSVDYLDYTKYQTKWNQIGSQNSQVQSEVVTFVNNTYDQWDAGKINSSDLVDPYLGAREYSPTDQYQSWALSMYTSLGLNSPANLSNFGSMKVTDHTSGINYTGIVMSDSNPESGQFKIGTTYDAANLSGTQYVVTDTQTYELEGDFTVRSAENADGETRTNITYRDVTYDTANLTEYAALTDLLSQFRQDVEVREQRVEDNAGSFSLPSFGGVPGVGWIAGFFALILLLVAFSFFKD